jgi:peptidyl-prolyl cis-trans isomerase B (cyclophilin B)
VRIPNLLIALASLVVFFTIPISGLAQGAGDPVVLLQTTKGPIAIRVYARMVPNTAMNFLDLVSRGFYNGLSFHRVENWVIQGGDPNGNGTGVFVDPQSGPRYLQLEINNMLKHNAAGVVAMARGKGANSASCQFYITKKASPALDGSYSIFGGVIQGMETVYNIQRGDRIVSAQIWGGGGGGGNRGGGGGGGRPVARPQSGGGMPQGGPSGDSGF